ncbi:hypothetical protein J6590_086881 [Homalodisca vitripennis]|nr:hypothetical protein J6590_086881 [Homalodisca vitripennis]
MESLITLANSSSDIGVRSFEATGLCTGGGIGWLCGVRNSIHNANPTDTSDLPSSINGSGPGVDRCPGESTVGSVIIPDPGCASELGVSTYGVPTAIMTSSTWVTAVLLARASKTSAEIPFL